MEHPGILLISTRKYKQFVAPLIAQIDENFLEDYPKTIFVFTDEHQPNLKSKNRIVQILIPSYSWPFPTLFRYKIFTESEALLRQCTHLFYLDVDYAIPGKVGSEFLTDGLVIVRHPGFYVNDGWGDSNNPVNSTSYLPKEKRKHYYCGGTQGGRADYYLSMAKELSENIEKDEINGIRSEWNDETHYNRFINLNETIPMTEFTPSYCMVEDVPRRFSWGLNNLEVKIVALNKNHAEIRS